MQTRLRTATMMAVFIVVLSSYATAASAMSNPSAIRWMAEPSAFVTSLYYSVLGRAPESTAVVSGWASQATTPAGKYRVFWSFVNSPEYQQKYGNAGGRIEWTIYYRRDPASTYYALGRQMPRGFHGVVWGPYNYWIGSALKNYLNTFYRR